MRVRPSNPHRRVSNFSSRIDLKPDITERVTDYSHSATLKTGRATRTLWALMLVGLAEAAYANAKVVYASAGALLATERVDAVIAGNTAVVKGEFTFSGEFSERTKNPSQETRVYFPLIGCRGTNWTVEDFKFALELNGTKPTSYAVATNAPLAAPESPAYSAVWIVARFPNRENLRWTPGLRSRFHLRLNVSYEQKLLDGVFYYLPIVEGTRRDSEELSITVQADRPIHSEGKGPGGCVILGARKLVFLPAHLGMIVVSTKPAADRGSGR